MKGLRVSKGIASLSAVLVLLAMIALFVAYTHNPLASRVEVRTQAAHSLAFARDALIDYSVNYPSHYTESGAGPGHLPCPDTDGNGSPAPSCEANAIGFLPVDFETAGGKNISLSRGELPADQALLYVVSSAFRFSPAPSGAPGSATVVNSDTVPELSLDGEAGIIALLISPGPELAGQRRDLSAGIAEYLEGENADQDLHFRSGEGNDQLLPIRWADLMPLVERRVLATAVESLERYRLENGYLPWLAPTEQALADAASVCEVCNWQGWLAAERYRAGRDWPPYSRQSCLSEAGTLEQAAIDLPIWFVRNFWHRYVWLHLQASDRDGACVPNSPSYRGEEVSAFIVAVGRAMAVPEHRQAQRRGASNVLSDYLDTLDWSDGDGNFEQLPLAVPANDQWAVVP